MTRAVIFDMFETLITHYQSPLYFGAQMAADAGISEDRFQSLWRPTENGRSIGKVTLEEVLEMILKDNQCYSEELVKEIAGKRIAAKEECFRHLHPEIIPMLSELKEKGYLIGLISNCFSEEADVIRKSELFPYFDAVYLSYEQGVQKPDEEIFQRCMDSLSVKAEECVYVGDGGSYELETAKKLGMKAVQAAWYLQEGTTQPTGRKSDFIQLEKPLDVLKHLEVMELKRLDYDFSVCKVENLSEIDLLQEFCFIGKTDEEISLVCMTEAVPKNDLEREDGWKAFRIQGVLDFSLIGILAKISTILADNKIGIFVVSTYNTDYILVKEKNFDKALLILEKEGYLII